VLQRRRFPRQRGGSGQSSDADSFRQLEELGLAYFFAAESFEAKSQEPPLKFSALLQGVIRLDAKRPGNLLATTFRIQVLESVEFRFGDELQVVEPTLERRSFMSRLQRPLPLRKPAIAAVLLLLEPVAPSALPSHRPPREASPAP
jgi:hypothetical protein